MRLNLNDIVGVQGAKKPFDFSLTLPDPPGCNIHQPAHASGAVYNVAGAVELRGELDLSMTCVCDRCTDSFDLEETLPITAYLAETLTDEENPDMFLLEGGAVDLDEVFTTMFLLDAESKTLCKEDCAGLCMSCGTNLNQAPCARPKEADPRLAALQQLLDME